MATQKELDAQRAKIEKLRAQVVDTRDKAAVAEAEVAGDIQMATLKAEEARLIAELNAAKAAAKAASGSDSPVLASLQEQQAHHEARSLAITNPEQAAKEALAAAREAAKAAEAEQVAQGVVEAPADKKEN